MARKTSAEIRKILLENPKLQKQMRTMANKVIKQEKEALLDEFNTHPVTREIEAGPNAINDSGTLGGKGNLFSFIGFLDTSDPIAPVRRVIKKIKVDSAAPTIRRGGLEFKVDIPAQEEFERASKMPWEAGRSWLFDIEQGISGLSHYLYKQFTSGSRSGMGMQIKQELNSGLSFSPVSYFGTMLTKFINKLKKI